jgi:hypothetical protein
MSKKVDTFLDVVESLSRYRRAELIDEMTEKNLIEALYVDPLNNDLLLRSMLSKNTTLLIGRKGTGKSTIINRFQHEIRKSNDKISLYIDVNTLFDQSKNSNFTNSLDDESQLDIQKLNLYMDFTKKIISEIENEINKNLFISKFKSFFTKDGLTEEGFKQEINLLFRKIENPQYKDISMQQFVEIKKEDNSKDINQASISSELLKASLKATISTEQDTEKKDFQAYSKILIRHFNIIEFMKELKELLEKLKIKTVFICLDDASELEKEHLEVFTNTIISPLNNLSNEFYKFKISLYPGRVYLPNIDRIKVDTFNLDYYDLYSIGNADKVEESAINYTKRLIETRFKHFFGETVNINDFFDVDNLYKLLFQISSNVPRSIGKILKIALYKSNSLERKINKRILQESAKQYYKDVIEYVLVKNEYIKYKSYDESFEQYHLYELLKKIIEKAVENKKYIGENTSDIFSIYNSNNAPSNYLHVPKEMEDILKTLEFNFFITKYSEQKNKDSNDISVFTLNYGLCIDNNIIFDEGSDRKFRIQRIFDYKNIVIDWLKTSNQLVCENCGQVYNLDERSMIDKYGCIKCKSHNVSIKPIVNDEFQQKLNKNFKLSKKEYDVLNILYTSSEKLTSSLIGAELDRSYQSVNHSIGRNSEIKQGDFISRIEENNRAYFEITKKGEMFITEGKII